MFLKLNGHSPTFLSHMHDSGIESQLMIMVRLRGLYLRRKILTTEDFDSCDQHCFFIKLNTAIILAYMHDNTNMILVLYYA